LQNRPHTYLRVMSMNLIAVACLLAFATYGAHADTVSVPDVDDDQLTSIYARDMEREPAPFAFGEKYMTGGAGEGMQMLGDGQFQYRQQVKSDSMLPAYCNPPNPCPKGYSESDHGCTEQFENTAEFSKSYQEAQNCICDQEHMRSCPVSRKDAIDNVPADVDELSSAIENYLQAKNGEKAPVAKKGDPDMNEENDEHPRKKRSAQATYNDEPLWQQGETLMHRAKKG